MKTSIVRFLQVLIWAIAIVSCRREVGGKMDSDTSKADRVHIGDTAPLFQVITIDGQNFSLEQQRGKAVVVDFFATWCGPCMAEMPHLETDIWQKYKARKFSMIALGREHTNEELIPFRQKNNLTFPMAGDTNRVVFGQYADAYIPRLLLIDSTGRILDQIVGFDEERLKQFRQKLEGELAKLE